MGGGLEEGTLYITVPPTSGVLGVSSILICFCGRGALYRSLPLAAVFGTLYMLSFSVGEMVKFTGISADSCERGSPWWLDRGA